jgi:hypothetical protein
METSKEPTFGERLATAAALKEQLRELELEFKLSEEAVRSHPDFNFDAIKKEYPHLVSVKKQFTCSSQYDYAELEPHLSGVDMDKLLSRVQLREALNPGELLDVIYALGGTYSEGEAWDSSGAVAVTIKHDAITSPEARLKLLAVARAYGQVSLTGAYVDRLLSSPKGVAEELVGRLNVDETPKYIFTWKDSKTKHQKAKDTLGGLIDTGPLGDDE